MDQKVSVIIPVYNAGKYLRRCLDSIANQTYPQLEVILIDDGSEDDSASICDDYCTDDRFQVLHKKNEGQARARNIGLDMSTGAYVAFVDSDDRIALDTLAYCVGYMEREQTDAVLFDCLMSEDLEAEMPDIAECVQRVSGNDIMRFYMEESTRNSKLFSPCLCLYRRDTLGDLRFREGKIYEDIDFKYKYLKRCRSIVVSNQIKYYYFVSGDSTVSGKLCRKNFELREADEIIYHLTQEELDPRVRFLGQVKRSRTAFSLLGRMARYGAQESEINENETACDLQKELRQNLLTLLRAPIGFKRKVLAVLMSVSYPLSKWLMGRQKTIYS